MNVTLAVYQRRTPSGHLWVTLGLGPHTRRRENSNAAKLQRKLVDELRNVLAAAPPRDLALFRMPPGVRLERVRLELSLRGEGGHRRAAGVFPLVLQTRWLTADRSMTVAYHPERQDDWFPVREEEPLDAQASCFFNQSWADLEPEDLERLKSDRKDGIRVLAFEARPKGLLERLGKKKGLWDDLDPRAKDKKQKQGRYRVLDRVGVSLTAQAVEGSLEGGMPREPYRAQLELLLGGEKKTPVLLVGPPGVGKRTLVRRFAQDLLLADGWATHHNLDRVHEVWEVSGKRIIAGMSYVGDWEARCLELLDDAREGRRVLFAEDLHAFGRIGRSRESDTNLALFFQGPLSRGELTLVGACTPEQLQRLEDDAPSFAALFTVLTVHATGAEETMRMLLHEARTLETRHAMAFSPDAFPYVLEQAGALWGASAFPGRALRLLRQAASDWEDSFVSSEEVLQALSSETGLPDYLLEAGCLASSSALDAELSAQVMGQPAAVTACRDLILRIRAGLTDPRRPWGVLLFAGPTGTGKTEMCKALASTLYGDGTRLLRFDMSEYQGPDAASRLAGDAFEPEGALVRAVRTQPFCVVLLDEIEKAHPSALHLLLQLLDEGRLSDAAGDTADFTHAVVVMTSNLGARARDPVGFGAPDARAVQLDSDRAIRDFFPPELFNRIDQVVHFAPLDPAVARTIAAKELARLLARPGLASRNVFVTVADEVYQRAVAEAFDARLGARPIKRWLEEQVAGRIAEALVRTPATMRRLELYVSGDQLRVDVQALVPRDPTPGVLTLDALSSAPPAALKDALREARAGLEALLEGEAFGRVAGELRLHVEGHQRGEAEHADPAYVLDALRQHVADVCAQADALLEAPEAFAHELLEVERFGFVERPRNDDERVRTADRRALAGPPRAVARPQLLDALAEIAFLRRALGRASDPRRHSATLLLTRLGAARASSRDDGRLLGWLARAYCGGRGTLEAFAARRVDGERLHGGPEALEKAWSGPGLEEFCVRLSGLCALDFWEGEHGLHAWLSVGRLPELVQVRVLDGAAASPEALLSELAARRTAFAAARSGGAPAGADPDAPLPVVRTYRFEPPHRSNLTASVELEDFELGWATTQRGKTPVDGLDELLRLRMGRAAEPAAGDGGRG